MNKCDLRDNLTGVLCIMMALMLAACATAPTDSRPQLINERAQQRWDDLISGDIERAYGYISPGYRSSVSLEQYTTRIRSSRVNWTKATYNDSDCLDSSCKVSIKLDYSLIRALPGVPRYDGSQAITENWLLLDGSWWFVPDS